MSQHFKHQKADHFDVVICGGGPVGLTMSFLLGRAGLSVAMFEKRPSTTTLPKGQYLHASTAEFFRQWGIWDLLHDAGWETEAANGQGFYVNVANGPVAAIRAIDGTHEDYVKKWEALSPVFPRKIPASDYEAAIRRRAESSSHASLHFNSRVTDVEQGDKVVRLTVEDVHSRAVKDVTARYVVACDGAHSFIRSRLGRGQDHGPTFGNQVLVEFRAELDDTLGKDGFFHSFILNPKYAGWLGSKHPENGLWRYSFRHDEETPPVHEVLLERIRGALGMPDLPIEIFQIYRFDYSTGLLRHWREKNVLFAGDAAHWHSPWGGFGMNSGIQDANNLAWKIELVLKGLAADSLLDTYEIERKSKAPRSFN
ncbi:MAG: FAD-dependent oxidoreductase [Pseudomonadota bacterium]